MANNLCSEDIRRLESQMIVYYPNIKKYTRKKRNALRKKLTYQLASEAQIILPIAKDDSQNFKELEETFLRTKISGKPQKYKKRNPRKPPQTYKNVRLSKNTRTVNLVPPVNTNISKDKLDMSTSRFSSQDSSGKYFTFKLIIPPSFGDISIAIEYRKNVVHPHILIPPLTKAQNADVQDLLQVVSENPIETLDISKNIDINLTQSEQVQLTSEIITVDNQLFTNDNPINLPVNQETLNCPNCKRLEKKPRKPRTKKKAAESTTDAPVKKRTRKANPGKVEKNEITKFFEEFASSINTANTNDSPCNYFNYPQMVTSTTKELATSDNPGEWDNNQSSLHLTTVGKEGSCTTEQQQVIEGENGLLYQMSIPNFSNDLGLGQIIPNNSGVESYEQLTQGTIQPFETSLFQNLEIQGQFMEQSDTNKEDVPISGNIYLNTSEYKDTLYQSSSTPNKQWVNESNDNAMVDNLNYNKGDIPSHDSKDNSNNAFTTQFDRNFQNSFYNHLLNCDYDTKIHSNSLPLLDNEITLLDPSEMYESLRNEERILNEYTGNTFSNENGHGKGEDSENVHQLSQLNSDCKSSSKSNIEILSIVPLPAIKEIAMLPKNELDCDHNDEKDFIHNSTPKSNAPHLTKEENGSVECNSKGKYIKDESQKDNYVLKDINEATSTLSKLTAELSEISFENEIDDDILSLTASSISSFDDDNKADFENDNTSSSSVFLKNESSKNELGKDKTIIMKNFKIPKIAKTIKATNVKNDSSLEISTSGNHMSGNLGDYSEFQRERVLKVYGGLNSTSILEEHCNNGGQNIKNDNRNTFEIAEIFGVTCLPYLTSICQSHLHCKLSHIYSDPNHVQNMLENLSESNLEIAYRFMYNHKQHFFRYFEVFSKIYVFNKNTMKLFSMVRDCERYEQGGNFLPSLFKGLLLCGIEKSDACATILQLVRNQKRFITVNNLLIIIMSADWTKFVDFVDNFAQLPRYKFHNNILNQIASTVLRDKKYVNIFVKCLSNLNSDDCNNFFNQSSNEVKQLIELLNIAAYECQF